jgi:hypothetical protein
LAQVTVKPLSGRSVVNPLFAPVMGLPARVVAEPLVATALSAVWIRLSERDYLAAILAAGYIAAGSHKPVHLQIGSA